MGDGCNGAGMTIDYAGGSQNFNEGAGAMPAWYQALMQSVAAFFFAVMILPAVVIFLGYLIYIVVMCIRELKKK